MITMKNLSLLQNEFSKRSMAMMINQKNFPFPINTMMLNQAPENKKIKLQDTPINMLVPNQMQEKLSGLEETTLTPIRKPNLILSNNLDKEIFSVTSTNLNKKVEIQHNMTIMSKDLPLSKEDGKHDSESTDVLSDSGSKCSATKKRRFNELEETLHQSDSVETEKAKREKEINALIDKYNFMISEKKRINKEKRKESKKKRGRLRKLAQDENGNDDDNQEEALDENGK